MTPNQQQSWTLLDKRLRPIIEFTSFVSLEVNNQGSVSTMPVEEGSFAAYNKTDTPLEARVTLAITGTPDVIGQAIDKLDRLKASTDTFSVLTPFGERQNMNLQSWDYAHKNDMTASVLIPTLHLVEIREFKSVYATVKIPPAKTKNKDHASKQKTGQKQPGEEKSTSMITDGINKLEEIFG